MEANVRDVEAAERASEQGELSPALVRRLGLTPDKLDSLCDGMRQLAAQKDIVGHVVEHRELDEGLVLQRITCPLGLLGVIFESRPDAVPQITSLAIKSGNAVLLKGGREAVHSNRALVEALRVVLEKHGVDGAAMGLLEDRSEVAAMLELDALVDLIIARGSGAFVKHIMANTNIAVMGHAEGLCHLYLHDSADAEMAARIAVDAKCSYSAACNAIETLLWSDGSGAAMARCVEALREKDVEVRGCDKTRQAVAGLIEATEADWSQEYTAPVLAVRYVADVDEALAHIARYGSKHTETLIAQDKDVAARFLAEVDAACVFHNASSRFADGYRFGLGAEVGISTGKLHARGPVGVEGLLTYRWLLEGNGQISTAYGPGKKQYQHKNLL